MDPSGRIIGLLFYFLAQKIPIIGVLSRVFPVAFKMPEVMDEEGGNSELEAGGGDLGLDEFVYAAGKEDVGAAAEESAILMNKEGGRILSRARGGNRSRRRFGPIRDWSGTSRSCGWA